MATKKVSIFISLKDGVSSGLQKINGALKITGRGFKAVGKAGAAAFGVITAGALLLASTVKKAFDFETLRTQIKVLVGSTIEAKRVFDELKEFSASTPFELPGIVAAYRQLKNFTGPALSTKKGLTLVGDAAAATSSDFKETAFWTGRLYSALKNGNPFLDSVGAMERLGIVGGELRGTLTKLEANGATMGQMWGLVEKDMLKFEGGMKELSSTGNGLISTLKDNWSIAVATFGEAFMDAAKGGITEMITTIKRLVDDGTITAWAEQAKSAFQAVVDTIKIITTGGGEARGRVVAALLDVIKAGFLEAATGAAAILAKTAPAIGRAIGEAAKLAFTGGERGAAEKELKREGGLEKRSAVGIALGTQTDRDAYATNFERITARVEANRKKHADEIGKAVSSYGKGFSGALDKFLDVLSEESVKAELAAGNMDLSEPAKEIAKTIANKFPKEIAKEAPSAVESSPEVKEASKEIADAVVAGVAPSSAAVGSVAIPQGPTATTGFAEISARLSGQGLSGIDLSRQNAQIARAEELGMESGVSGLGGIAGDLASQGMAGLDLQRAVDTALSAELAGRDSAEVDMGAEAIKTNELIEAQNKILEERLGGVN